MEQETAEMYLGFSGNHKIRARMLKTISDILISGKLKPKYVIHLLKNPKVIDTYEKAFTHKTFDPVNNYECFEFLGDGTVNNSVGWYLYNKFPEYANSINPSEVLTRAKITIIQARSLANFAKTTQLLC